jgi:hypothetical protein
MSLVVVRLIGGLGNQMFQYAAGRALALRRGATLKLDLGGFAQAGITTRRSFELDVFPLQADLATGRDLAALGLRPGPEPRWRRYLSRVFRINWPPKSRIYREPHFRFDPNVAQLALPVYLDGYWQSEKYFADIAETLRREFTPRAPLDPDNAALAARIDQVNAVSLHVRRGDYVSDADTNRYHGTCSLDYFRQAVDHIRARVPDAHLFVFSDDREWTRNNLTFPLPTTFVDVNPPDRGYRDMQLMARCRHHVLANSSFSWWGAWLDPSPDKIVVAPRRWFSAPVDTRDLVPESWIRL